MAGLWEQPAVVGALIGSGTTISVGLIGYMYSWWLKRTERLALQEAQHQSFTTDALKAQLEGWVTYSRELNSQIGALRKELTERDERIAALERGRSDREIEITTLWRKIREMESQCDMMVNEADVLIVDDNVDHGRAMQRILRSGGYSSSVTRDAEEAIHQLCDGNYKLGLIDIILNGTSGLDVALRAGESGCGIPLIAVSGAVNALDKSQMDRAKFIAVLNKPIRSNDLLDIVKKHIPPRQQTE